MQLSTAGFEGRRVTVRTGRFGARRLWAALFALTVGPAVVWSAASAAERSGEQGPAPTEEAIVRAKGQAEPMLLAASIARAPGRESVTATAARRQTRVKNTPQPAADAQTVPAQVEAAAELPARTSLNLQRVSAQAAVTQVSDEAGPQLMAQAAPAPAVEQAPVVAEPEELPEAAPGFETGSALVRPDADESESASEREEEADAAAPEEFFRPIGEDDDPNGLEDGLAPLSAGGTAPGVELAPGLDVNELRTAAPQSRRLSSAMHRAAASTAASLSSETAFGSAFDPKRFNAGASSLAVDREMNEAVEFLQAIPGLRLENVMLTAGYSSNGIPGAGYRAFNTNVGSDYDMGAQATLAYRNSGRSSIFSLTYKPTHIRRARLSEWNTTNHLLSLSTSKDLGRRWTVAGGLMAQESGLEQVFVTPAVFSTLNNTPSSIDELIQMVESGQLTDDQFASALTGTPVVDQPAERHLNMSRGFISSSMGRLSYSYSPRLTLSVSGRMSRFQLLRNDRLAASQANNPLFFNAIFSQGISADADYRLSGRRSIGVTHTENFRGGVGPYGNRRDTSSEFFLRERLGRNWSYTVRGGIGAIGGAGRLQFDPSDPTGQIIAPTVDISRRTTWVGSGMLSYRLGTQYFVFSAGRRVGNTFNFGNRAAINAGLGWRWNPRRSLWSFQANGNYFQANSGTVLNGVRGFQSRQVSAGFTRTLTPSTAFSTDFQFGYFNTPYFGLFTNNSIRRVQMSFIWRPDTTER